MTSEVAENVTLVTTPAEAAPANKSEDKAAVLTAMRLEKVQQHLREALGKADSLEANLGAVSADLMLMACRLKESIEEAFARKSLGRIEKLMPAIDAYLRVARQIGCLATLDHRLALSRTPTEPSKSR